MAYAALNGDGCAGGDAIIILDFSPALVIKNYEMDRGVKNPYNLSQTTGTQKYILIARSLMRAISSIVARITLALVGVMLIYGGVRTLKLISANLVMTQAEVVSSSMKYSDTGDKSYDISYQYQVNGEKFTGSFNSKNGYATGSNIQVYYNPDSPEPAFRSIDESKSEGTLFLVGGIALVLFVASWQWKIIAKRRM